MTLPRPAALAPLFARPVAVFGGGVSGDGVCALVAAAGGTTQVYDAQGTVFTAAHAAGHDLVVYSPGFVPDHHWLTTAQAAGAKCLGELDFASLFWRGAIVAITGTNGKTTLTEFLTQALRTAGKDAHATGNIGRSFSGLAVDLAGGGADCIAVCEVSSFQAETMRHFQPTSVLWTNFAEDHLERHPGLKAYFSAKWTLVGRTPAAGSADVTASGVARGVFLSAAVQRAGAGFGFRRDDAVVVATQDREPDPALAGSIFADYPQRENFLLAAAWWHAAGLDPATLLVAARQFQLGRHRLTRVAEHAGVTYWNDSKATNFHAVEAALARFSAPVFLILGGKPKGGDLAAFVRRLAPQVRHVLLIGATSNELAGYCDSERVSHTRCGTLAAAVRQAAAMAPAGAVVLLSPAFASFDQFRNYEDRGEQFEQLVHSLASASPRAACAQDPI